MKRTTRAVPSAVYTKEYYLHDCLGFTEFTSTNGKKIHPRVLEMLGRLELKPGMKVLDVGCGRGDLVTYCARSGMDAIGIDYSKDGIALAKGMLKKQPKKIQSRIQFFQMDAKQMMWKPETFDIIFSFDVFEHLYPEELEIVMDHMQRMLKKDGVLLVHTEPNKWYLDYSHRFYIYPMSELLIALNKAVTGKLYPGIPKDPRSEHHKQQHVNEPTYFYLRSLFDRHDFAGEIEQVIGLLKPVFSWKDRLYNMFVLLYPLCLFPPLVYFFSYDYVCTMRKKNHAKT